MSKQMMLGVLGAIVVLGGGAYLFLGNGAVSTENGGASAIQGAGEALSSGKRSINSIMAEGVTQVCTFETADESAQSSGTIYIANGDFRGDFTSLAEGETINSHMIQKPDGAIYMWTDGAPQGIKMTLKAETNEATGETETPPGGAFDASIELNYNCNAWTADASAFAIPSDVVFLTI